MRSWLKVFSFVCWAVNSTTAFGTGGPDGGSIAPPVPNGYYCARKCDALLEGETSIFYSAKVPLPEQECRAFYLGHSNYLCGTVSQFVNEVPPISYFHLPRNFEYADAGIISYPTIKTYQKPAAREDAGVYGVNGFFSSEEYSDTSLRYDGNPISPNLECTVFNECRVVARNDSISHNIEELPIVRIPSITADLLASRMPDNYLVGIENIYRLIGGDNSNDFIDPFLYLWSAIIRQNVVGQLPKFFTTYMAGQSFRMEILMYMDRYRGYMCVVDHSGQAWSLDLVDVQVPPVETSIILKNDNFINVPVAVLVPRIHREPGYRLTRTSHCSYGLHKHVVRFEMPYEEIREKEEYEIDAQGTRCLEPYHQQRLLEPNIQKINLRNFMFYRSHVFDVGPRLVWDIIFTSMPEVKISNWWGHWQWAGFYVSTFHWNTEYRPKHSQDLIRIDGNKLLWRRHLDGLWNADLYVGGTEHDWFYGALSSFGFHVRGT